MTTKPIKPKRNVDHLKPYQFKPGNNANPKGRPREKLSKHERLVILSEIAKHQIESAVSAGHKIAAIRESNLMEGVYQEAQTGYIDNRTVNIIVSSDKAKELTENVSRRLLPEAANQETPGEV